MKHYPEIVEHYGAFEENDRLNTPHGQLEFLRTQTVLRQELPGPPAIVYDVGGGTGPYADWLGSLGYESHLIDIVPRHIEQARSKPSSCITSAYVGDARALDVPNEIADVVLLLGPLYHLPDRQDRVTCWREAARILKPSGLVVAAIISRFASLLDGLSRDLVADPAFRSIVEVDLDTGVHANPLATPNTSQRRTCSDPPKRRRNARKPASPPSVWSVSRGRLGYSRTSASGWATRPAAGS